VPGSAEASDQMSFIEHGVPGVQLFTGAHGDYHRPGDVAAKIDGAGLAKVATLAKEAVVYLGGREEPLTVTIEGVETARASAPEERGSSGGRRVRIGTIPDFAFPGPGVRVESVGEDSPAAKAGIEAGDVLLRIEDRALTDLRAYSDVLKTLQPGEEVTVHIRRGEEELALTVTVETR